MSFLDGIADAIGGSSDPSTEDQNGLTQADRRKVLFGGLTNMGALLLAAGQPQYGSERARYLAQLGSVPGNMQSMAYNMGQQKLLGMKTQQAAIQMQQAARERQVLASPEFQQQLAGLDPATAALLKAAAAGGDMGTVSKIYDSMQPKMSYSGVVFDPRRGLVIDPYTGTRTSIAGTASSPQTPGNAVFRFQRTPGLDPNATDTTLLNSLPPLMKANIEGWLQGKLPVPTSSAMRDPRIQQQLALAHTIDPSFDAADYPTRQKFMASITSGPAFTNVIAPARKFLNHAASYLQSWDKLGLDNGPQSFVTNPLKIAHMQAERNGLVKAAQTNLQGVKEEFEKFMGGKGQLTDMARQAENDLSLAGSQDQQREVIGKMVDLMHGQLDPYVEQRQAVLKNSGYVAPDLLDNNSRAALGFVKGWHAPAPGTNPGVAPGATPAQASQNNLPPTVMYEYRRDPQTGKLQRRLRQGATNGR